MPNIQFITDGHPNNTTLIIDGIDVSKTYDICWIKIDSFGSDPESPALPYFKLSYKVLETDLLNPKIIQTSVKDIIVLPDQAGAMQQGQNNN